MRRIVASLLVVVLLAGLVAVCTPTKVSAESLYIRKIVSVVYDDSGSMTGDKWAYANYAMQAFCGMLNSEDQLFITYMSHTQVTSSYDPEEADLSANGIQGSVDSIRSHVDCGSTPYEAVEIAYDKLRSVNDSNPNTQYWLVVITDGSFDSGERKNDLNNNFTQYASSTMPNGTNPQITFLAIGDSVISPDSNENKGIYTYASHEATGIIDVMSQMADRISGRTRLDKDDITQIDENTIQISSAIPLLNIAVLSQETDAVITEAVYSNEKTIPVSRSVSLGYPNYKELVGGAFLIGDSQNVIGAGTYNIRFDKAVSAEDIVILLEPALEMRMTVTVNGEEVTNHYDLQNVTEGDQVSVSCKIYEMGTDTEISPDLMPPNTTFEITVSEGGKVVEQSSGKEMLLEDYILDNIETEIKATVLIDGFNPIDYSTKFTPAEFIPPPVYTVTAELSGDSQSIRYDDLASNRDLSILFTVYADGVQITDAEQIKALNPQITAEPAGNSGSIVVGSDGRIVFTPNAGIASESDEYYDVTVSCTVDTATASETYRVLIADYQVVPVDAAGSIVKTEFYGNDIAASFYVTKDGVRLTKQEVEGLFTVTVNEAFEELELDTVIQQDGTIICTPRAKEERVLHFGNWWINWWYYFSLPGEDLTVTLRHAYGSAQSSISVVGEDVPYILLNVAAPLALEILILAVIAWWIYAYFAKPRFWSNAVLYTGKVVYNETHKCHEILSLKKENLGKYNKFKYLYKPWLTPETFAAGTGKTVNISPDYCGRIICKDSVWYSGEIEPTVDTDPVTGTPLETPADIMTCLRHIDSGLEIEELKTADSKVSKQVKSIDRPSSRIYYVATNGKRVVEVDDRLVISEGVIFCYVTEGNI